MKHKLKAKFYVRYADDFVALSWMRAPLIKLVPKIKDLLREELLKRFELD